MVKVGKPSDEDLLDTLIRAAAARHGLLLDVEGWSRRTYDVLIGDRLGKKRRVARIESYVVRDGMIRVFEDIGLPFAEDLGAEIEKAFTSLKEVVIVRDRPPE